MLAVQAQAEAIPNGFSQVKNPRGATSAMRSLHLERYTTHFSRQSFSRCSCEAYECLNHYVILNDRQLKRTLSYYFRYYHESRTHLSLAKQCTFPREAS